MLSDSIVSKLNSNVEFEHLIYRYNNPSNKCHKSFENPENTKIFDGPNIGFGRGINCIANYSSYNILYLINPDTLLEKFSFEEILFKLHENVIIGPEQLISRSYKYWGNLGSVNYENQKEISFSGLSCDIFFQAHKTKKIPVYIDGAGLIILKETFNNLGGFDENFFLFGEDLDLSFRLRSRGGQINTLSQNSIIHYSGGSIGGGAPTNVQHETTLERRNYTEFNSLQIALKNLELYYLIFWVPIWIFFVLSVSLISFIILKPRYSYPYWFAVKNVLRISRSLYLKRRINISKRQVNSIKIFGLMRFVPSAISNLREIGLPKLRN